MLRISELFNVNSFIVSQTNPFAIPFMDAEDGGGFGGKKTSFWTLFKNLIGSEIKLRFSQVSNNFNEDQFVWGNSISNGKMV